MSEVQKILERTQRSEEIDGVRYVVRRATGAMYLQAFGSGFLGMIEAADDKPKTADIDAVLANFENMRKLCAVAMVSPRMGEVTDASADVIAWADMGDHQKKVFDLVTGGIAEKAVGFPLPSEDQGG